MLTFIRPNVLCKVLCLCSLFLNTAFTSLCLLVYCFPLTATGWTSAAFCPNHTMALQISSESTGCE